VLLDTNIVVDVLRRDPSANAFMARLTRKPSLSVVTAEELFAGARSRREELRIDAILDAAIVLPVSREIARLAGQAIKHYRASHGLDDFDAIIAATADHHGLALATLNVKHFPMLPKLKPAY
jgi:predicted nucleic acid-binding protein